MSCEGIDVATMGLVRGKQQDLNHSELLAFWGLPDGPPFESGANAWLPAIRFLSLLAF